MASFELQNGKKIPIDSYLKSNLDTAKEHIQKDFDMVFCVDGNEGSGKSVLCQQMAYYCDPTLTIDRICFTPEEFKEAITKASKFQAVIYDEAMTGLYNRRHASEISTMLVSLLAEIRQKQLFVFIVMPCFFELNKYVAIWRSRALIHVWTGKNFERGYFTFFSADKKKLLYIKGKKFYQYNVKGNFYGYFKKGYVVDEDDYRHKKLQSLKRDENPKEELSNRRSKYYLQRNALIEYMYKNGTDKKVIAELTGLNPSSVQNLIKLEEARREEGYVEKRSR